jgi:hypothetical protein
MKLGSWKLEVGLVNCVHCFTKILVYLGTEKAPGTKLTKSNFLLPTSCLSKRRVVSSLARSGMCFISNNKTPASPDCTMSTDPGPAQGGTAHDAEDDSVARAKAAWEGQFPSWPCWHKGCQHSASAYDALTKHEQKCPFAPDVGASLTGDVSEGDLDSDLEMSDDERGMAPCRPSPLCAPACQHSPSPCAPRAIPHT